MKAIATLALRPFVCLVIGLTAHLHAATAKDLEGEWVLDGAATWEGFKNLPHMKAMTPERQKKQEALLVDPANQTTLNITEKTFTQTSARETRSMSYTITKIDGDLITIEATTDDGKKQINHLLVTGDVLQLTHPQEPTMVWISRRKPTPAK